MRVETILNYMNDGTSVSFLLKKISSEDDFSGFSFIVILTTIIKVFRDNGFSVNEKELKKSIKIIPKEELGDLKREVLLRDFKKILANKKV